MGVGYYVYSSYDGYTDHGILSVSIGCDVKRVEEVISAILAELKKFADELVPAEELEKTQEYLLGTMLLGLESSDELAEFYGYQEILHRPLRGASEIAKEIKGVTAEDVQRVAKSLLVDAQLNLACVGPLPSEAKIKAILHF
jgi:zinc protease